MARISIPFKMPKKKVSVIIIGLIIIIMVTSVGISVSYDSDEEEPIAIISIANDISRAFQPVQFFGEDSKGDIDRYHWDFDDGNTSDEQNPVHKFNVSGWYNVTLVVQGKNEMKSSSTVTIGIQLPDQEDGFSRGSARYWRPSVGHISDAHLLSHPNIGNPRIEAHLNVINPVGSVMVYAYIHWYNLEYTESGTHTYYREEYIATGTNIDYHLIIEPDQVPEEIGDLWAMFNVYYRLDDGRDGGVSLTTSITFPVEDLSPSWQVD
jgi:PKD repeat protein